MKNAIEIKVCESLQKEAVAVLAAEGWPDVIPKAAAPCFGCRIPWPKAPAKGRSEDSGGGDNFCSPCCAVTTDSPVMSGENRSCTEILAGKAICDFLAGQGALLVTPGQMERWQRTSPAPEFPWRDAACHGQTTAKVVLLDSGVDSSGPENVRAFAESLGLPWEIVPVGLEHFRLVLKDTMRSLGREDGSPLSRQLGSEQGCATFHLSERKYHSLFEATPISVWEVDFSRAKACVDALERQEGGDLESYFDRNPEAGKRCIGLSRVLEVNRATLQLFRSAAKDQFLQNSGRLLTEEFLRPFRDGLIALVRGAMTFEGVGLHRTTGGDERTFRMRFSVVPGYETTLEMVIVSFNDITERCNIEQALGQINRVQSQFISTAAHELRTPLTSVLGYTELLLNPETVNGIDADQQRDYLKIIFEKAEALNRIADDLFDLSRIDAGETIPLAKAPCRIQSLIEEVVDRYRRAVPDHRFEVALSAGADELVDVDRRRIVQVLENLLSNAVKYSPAHTLIRLVGEVGENGFDLSVEDEGIGMDRQQTRRIFDKFYRADASNTAVQGFGLGMSIAKDVVAAHGGRIWVDSRRGRGTKVTFSLPASSA